MAWRMQDCRTTCEAIHEKLAYCRLAGGGAPQRSSCPGKTVMLVTPGHIATRSIAASAIVGVIVRPWRLPEALWAVLAALALLLCSLIPFPEVVRAVAKGTDVYL